jgi:HSP20 family protein
MSIVRWDPFRELEDVSSRLNRVFGRGGLTMPSGDPGKDTMTAIDWAPSVDVSETAEEFVIKAELPGVQKENIKVSVEDGVLRLQGERRQEREEKGKKYHRVERQYGSFLRTFTLPDNVDESKILAEAKDGVLNVRLPKSEKTRAKAVEVKVG